MAQVLILAADRELGRRITAVLADAGCTAVACDGRARFQRHAAAALSAVVVARALGVDGWITWLTGISGEHPELPLVVVTAKGADNLRLLARIRVHAVPYPSELDHLPALAPRSRSKTSSPPWTPRSGPLATCPSSSAAPCAAT